jgi:hypothetical protein
MDGLQVVSAFSDEKALLTWSRKETQFTAMKSQDVLEFCQAHGIDRIIINIDQPNMFVLERDRTNIKSEKIQQETKVQVWTPKNPIAGNLREKMRENFSKVSTIREVFHFGMTRNQEHVFMLAFHLDTYSEDAKFACMNAIQNAMAGEQLEFPLEVLFLENTSWRETAKNISGSLLYQRQ